MDRFIARNSDTQKEGHKNLKSNMDRFIEALPLAVR